MTINVDVTPRQDTTQNSIHHNVIHRSKVGRPNERVCWNWVNVAQSPKCDRLKRPAMTKTGTPEPEPRAFEGLQDLQALTLPASVEVITGRVFWGRVSGASNSIPFFLPRPTLSLVSMVVISESRLTHCARIDAWRES
jgi:hypothetical protein